MRKLTQFTVMSAILISLATSIAGADSPTTMPASMLTTAPVTINWDQAKDYIGQTVTVTGPVIGTHDFGGAAVLNIGKDYPDPGRFTVYLSADNRAAMPPDLDNGKTISVTGTLKTFHDVPEIEADSAHITVINPPTTAPTTQP
jgi:hypothetical protein